MNTRIQTPATIDRNRLLAFDLETTGPDPRTAHVVTSALVAIDGPGKVELRWMADPGIEIPEGATAVHGVTTAQAREHGRPHAEVVAETIAGIRRGWQEGRTLVVFNAAYDLTILRRWDPSFEVLGPVVDPYVVDRATDPYRRGKRTLEALCLHHRVQLDGAHEAAADALAAARLAWKLLGSLPDLTGGDWRAVNTRQALWHEERQRDFAAYLEKSGKDASDVNTEWPIAVA
ncbi:exonuclease domain-containing protein [Dietzia sp. PP-33]|jgi:DNA polymerase-3 subunit epsilon|uniref:exonuclease domain-containing protein n=1 Tax=Dietzia sp. PP-33 TaxID=2957500 RepID=UPI0029A70B2A|nr:exonuclease domain-containing protein [Dietzia sp. PP-33]MDX2355702.1 exonuclease domain-containing protein [Dietzia sp. PP-33]